MSIKLGDICSFQSGGTPSKTNADYFSGSIPWITTVALNGKTIGKNEAVDWITEKAIVESAAKIVPARSVMVGTRVGVGKVAINDIPLSTNQDVISLVGIDEGRWNKEYICRFIQSKERFLKSQARGATIKGIKVDVLSGLSLPDLSVAQQEFVTTTLEKASGIITARQSQLSALDDLIKARFVEMFGDAERYPQESLDSNVHEMFIGPFGSVLKNDSFVDPEDGFCIVYEQKHAIKKTMDVPTRYVDEKKYRELRRFSVYPGDIIVSCRGTIGEIFIVPEGAPLGIMHPSIMKIRLNTEKYNQKFFVLALENYMEEHNNEAKGSGVKMAVTATTLGREAFPVPPMEVQKQFAAFVDQIDKSKSVIQKSLDETRVLFDSLMQQYFC